MRRLLAVAVFSVLFGGPPSAQALPIGVLAFDALVPGPGGLSTFSITNLTGGFALSPEFPVQTEAVLRNARLQLDTAGGPLTFDLGDIGPGPFLDLAGVLLFPDDAVFSAAWLTATLDPLALLLPDSTFFNAASPVTARLAPSNGSFLQAGIDWVVIEADAAVTTAPEPSALALMAVGLTALGAWQSRRRRR